MQSQDSSDVNRCLAGDQAAYARLVARHQADVAKRMMRFTRDRHECEELVQTVMVSVVLLSGVLIGAGGTVALLRHRFTRAQQPARPALAAATFAAQMRREYALTDEQAQRVEDALRARLHEAAESRRQFFVRVGAARDGFLTDMKAFLSPAQYERLEHRAKTRERRFRWLFGLPSQSQDHSPPAAPSDGGQEQP